MTTTNPIITRLANVLNAKTEAALQALASLDAEILDTLAEMEEAARARFHLAQVQLDINTKDRLQAFAGMLDNLAADAMGRAVSGLLSSIEELASTISPSMTTQPTTPTVEVIPEPMPEPVTVTQPVEQIDPEYIPAPLPVAAHAVEPAPVGILPEDDQDQDDEEDGIEDAGLLSEQFDEIEATDCPDGLHERQGTGRKTRYTLVEFPLPGEVYYRKQGRKWLPVRYMA